jgi:60 kDa SS-A/Ro ribonucleoprotein
MNALQLFQFVVTAHNERGWGRGLRSVVAHWYVSRPVSEVAADILKCPEHDGWTHRDLLRLAHPVPATQAQNALFQWAVDGTLGHLATSDVIAGELRQVYAVERLKQTDDQREVISLVEQYSLTHDMVPGRWKGSPAVWESLLTCMSYADIVQNIMSLADCGLLANEGPATALVVARLIDSRRAVSSGVTRQTLIGAQAEYKGHPRALSVVMDALDAARELVRC